MCYGNTSCYNKYPLPHSPMQGFWLIHTPRLHLVAPSFPCAQNYLLPAGKQKRERQCGEGSLYIVITCSARFTSAHTVLVRTCQPCSHLRCKVGFGTYSCADQLLPNHYYENRTMDFGSPSIDHPLPVTRSITSGEAVRRGCGISFHQIH